MNALIPRVLVLVLLVAFLVGTAAAVTIETVPVGNLGNAGQLSGEGAGGMGPDRICGSVDYAYRIGKYEITAGQYCEFLNAVATSDPYGLYSTDMDIAVNMQGCDIIRHGSPGTFTYSVTADWSNRPVNCVSWADAARFANWMHNGQPVGAPGLSTTEDGSYYLNGANTDAAFATVTRTPEATWVIPSEDEWYKAAYHKSDGVTGNYWDYPTGTDTTPSNDLDGGGNGATFRIGESDYTIGGPYYRTEVGAHENSKSPYGTFDQGGNVWEWNEAVFGLKRGTRGGMFFFGDNYLLATFRDDGYPPTGEGFSYFGFRLVQVPEPMTIVMLALGSLGICRRRRA